VEGNWILRDAKGQAIATSEDHPNAVLVLEPIFYAGNTTQIAAQVETKGKGGRVVKQVIRVSSSTGKMNAEQFDKKPKRIEPTFDRPAPQPKQE